MSIWQIIQRWISAHPWRSLFLLLFVLSVLSRQLGGQTSGQPQAPATTPPPAVTRQAASPPNLPAPPPSRPEPPQLSFSPKQTAFAQKAVPELLSKGLLAVNSCPPLGTIVYVEPKLWTPMLHKEKAAFTEMLLCYLHHCNTTLPAAQRDTRFAVYNLTTRQRLATAILISTPLDSSAGHIRILK